MRKYHRKPRKTRSSAQKAQVLTLTSIRIQRQAERLSGVATKNSAPANNADNDIYELYTSPSASSKVIKLQRELDSTKRKLKNSLQREKRAKATVTQKHAELSTIHHKLAECDRKITASQAQLEQHLAATNSNLEALQNVQKELINTKHRLEQQLDDEKLARGTVQAQLQASQDDNAIKSLALADTTIHLNSSQKKLENLKAENIELGKSRKALQKQLTRSRVKFGRISDLSNGALGSPHCLSLKDPTGTICPEVRNLLRQLAGDGVATEKIMDVIYNVVNTFKLTLTDSVSARSVSRAVLEGLIQSQIQIAVEIDGAECLSICGDGTTIKNQNYEARLLHAPATSDTSNPPPMRTLGVQQAPSHTSQSQLTGWKSAIADCCDLLRRAPLGQHTLVDERNFAAKLGGIVTDHASDQKRLVELMLQWKTKSDRELCGEEALSKMSIEEQIEALSEHLEEAKKLVTDWESLPSDSRNQLTHDAWSALALSMGEEAFGQLSGDEKEVAAFFAWSGCCMHKELNAVKGGVASMQAEWHKLGLTPPLRLPSQQEVEQHPSKQTTRNSGQMSGGAIKLTTLAGLVFNHRDDKRGHQDTYRYWFEQNLGYMPTFPDTSNTRYGSHCDAAAELLVNQEGYLKYMGRVCGARGNGRLANIETNVCNGLQDSATLTELAVLALYSQAISKPYMKYVRGTRINALELGEYHEKVKQHCRKIQENPYLLMEPSTGLLDGGEWERADVIEAVKKHSKDIPNLWRMLPVFFAGALKTWERFTQEFLHEGTISQASSKLRTRVWNNPTNDASEGALGQARQMIRRMPAITENQRNGRVMWAKNKTQDFVDNHFSEADHAFVRNKARRIDASGHEKAIRTRQVQAFEQRANENEERRARAQARKSTKQQALAGVRVLYNATREELEKLTVKDLDSQIDKLRETNSSVPAKSTLRKKADKVAAVQQALMQFVSPVAGASCLSTQTEFTGEEEHYDDLDDGFEAERESMPAFQAEEDDAEWAY